jgi:peptidoglycan hydrolase-like protein with peptidoglycan-binding domain
MKRIFASTLAVLIAATLNASADELTKSVQSELKNQGFYYGEVTGLNSPETAAAVKRYQIRNGLEATGTLTPDTLEALGIKGGASTTPSPSAPPALEPPRAQPARPATRPPAATRKEPPVDLRRDRSDQESDREYVDRPNQAPPEDTRPAAPTGGGEYGRLFARTPYASAPLEVQETTVRKAQRFLRELDFYRRALDGRPGPALEEALAEYQRFIKLPPTGRLDMETLSAMRLLPGRGGAPVRSAPRPIPGRPLRGIWID